MLYPATLISRGRYSSSISLLNQLDNIGVVQSIFENGLNLNFGNNLVFIGAEYGNGVPFGIHIESYLYDRILAETFIGEEVAWSRDKLQLSFASSNIHIIISVMDTFDSRLTVRAQSKQLTALIPLMQASAFRMNKELGWELSLDEALTLIDQQNTSSELFRNLIALSRIMEDQTHEIDKDLIQFFIGRGRGLTPTGDDFLVGIMAVEHLFSEGGSKVTQAVRRLKEELPRLTSQVSANYYYSAITGCFSTVILDFLASLADFNELEFEECAARLMNVGSSSGIDTYFGIMFAILSYENVIHF
jgi:Protein of unknown function (DUF2877)